MRLLAALMIGSIGGAPGVGTVRRLLVWGNPPIDGGRGGSSGRMSDVEAVRWSLVWTAHAMNNRNKIITVGITGARGYTGFVRQRFVR